MKHLRKLFHFVKPYWKRATMALILLSTLVIMDLAIPRLVQRIIDQGIVKQDQQVVLQTSLVMIGISILSAALAVGNSILSVQVGESVARDIREALFKKIQTFSYGDLDQHQTGQLMVRLTSDTAAVQRITQVSLRIGTRAPLLITGSLILMINTSPQLALTMLPLLVVTSAIIMLFIIKMEPLFRRVQQKLDSLNNVLQENIAGARLVKAFVRAKHEGDRFGIVNEAFTGDSIQVMQFMSSMGPVLTFLVNVGMVVVIWAGGLQSIRGGLSVGQIVAFTNYLLTTMTPLTMMTLLSNAWANGMASAKRINEVLDVEPEVQEVPDAIALPANTPGRVDFRNVGFHYNGDTKESVLENVNLTAHPGEMVAILGATGSGKSTLVDLIPRFYDVTSGNVLIDGLDVRQLREDTLLAQVGIVPQDAILFSGTILENLRYGAPDASKEEVMAAAKAARAHDFIMGLPEGYDSRVEARGANFSGGQKQRLTIARALLMKPKILILDDSTSAVDVETETQIQDALEGQTHPHTSFVVAQRISTVLRADKIVVLDRGRIAAEGTHQQLMQTSSIYREIYESQLGNGIKPVKDNQRKPKAGR